MNKQKRTYLISSLAITAIIVGYAILRLTNFDISDFEDLARDYRWSEMAFYLLRPFGLSGLFSLILYFLQEGKKDILMRFADCVIEHYKIILIAFFVLILFGYGLSFEFDLDYFYWDDFAFLLLPIPFVSAALTFLIVLPLMLFIETCIDLFRQYWEN